MMKPNAHCLEDQQLELISPQEQELRNRKPTFGSKLRLLWQSLITKLTESSELRVWSTQDCVGNTWWSAYDPVTGQSIYEIPEAKMRIWIEQRHYRRFNSTSSL